MIRGPSFDRLGPRLIERKQMFTLNQYKKFDKLTAPNDSEDFLSYRLENFGVKEYKMFFSPLNDWEIEDIITNN